MREELHASAYVHMAVVVLLVSLIIQTGSGHCIHKKSVYILVLDVDIPLYAQKKALAHDLEANAYMETGSS